MIYSMILVFGWSLVHGFLEDLWESNHWQLILSLIRFRCGIRLIQSLSQVAKDKPQALFAAITMQVSMQFKWNHIQLVIPD